MDSSKGAPEPKKSSSYGNEECEEHCSCWSDGGSCCNCGDIDPYWEDPVDYDEDE